MQEILKNISEEFDILNEERNKIINKPFQTEEDKETLKVIEELYKELAEKLNNWAAKKNEMAKQEKEPKEKSLREQYEEITQKVDKLQHQSQKMQPILFSTNKMIKEDILSRNGFVKTTTADNRKRMIHESLIEEYTNLVKEQRRLQEELNKQYFKERDKNTSTQKDNLTSISDMTSDKLKPEKDMRLNANIPFNSLNQTDLNFTHNNISLDESISEVEDEINSILMSPGKKDRVKYRGKIYVVPTNRKGYFINKMQELNRLELLKENQEKSIFANETHPQDPITEELDYLDDPLDEPEENTLLSELNNNSNNVRVRSKLNSETLSTPPINLIKFPENHSILEPEHVEDYLDDPLDEQEEAEFLDYITSQETLLGKNSSKAKLEENSEFLPNQNRTSFTNIEQIIQEALHTGHLEDNKEKKQQSISESVEQVLNEFLKNNPPQNEHKISPSQNTSIPPIQQEENNIFNEPKPSNTQKQPERVTGEVIGVRRSKKNIKKRLILGISTVATALVLIIAIGSPKIFNKKDRNRPLPKTSAKPEAMSNQAEEDLITIISNSGVPVTEIETESEIQSERDLLRSDATRETESTFTESSTNQTEIETETEIQSERDLLRSDATRETESTSTEPSTEQPEKLEQLTKIEPYSNEDSVNLVDDLLQTTISNSTNSTLEKAFMDSNLKTNMAWDEYSALNKNWQGVKEDNIKWWIDAPLRFTKDEKTGTYLIEQQNDNNEWIAMGFTDEETAQDYFQKLYEQNVESQNSKGARR